MAETLEELIAFHCAPAMAGIKAANLVSCSKANLPDAEAEVTRLNRTLNQKDIYIRVLCSCRARLLLMVYRKSTLAKQLADPEIAGFLTGCGYPSGSLEAELEILRGRMQCDAFPHEIGAFLGYPLPDIQGFLHPEEQKCLLVGDWKVYHNPEHARRLFRRYRSCRLATYRLVRRGRRLGDLFRAP